MNFKNKKILITGHSGFIGSWLYYFLIKNKNKVYGVGLKPKNKKDLFNLLKIKSHKNSKIINILDNKNFENYVKKIKPDIVIHLAAESLVLNSFHNPYKTFETNVTGTLNMLNLVKKLKYINTAIFFTTDKVYQNVNSKKKFTENDPLGGDDPYSASKTASEMLINSYSKSFLSNKKIVILRSGNIIGGGDNSNNRIIPDIIKSITKKKTLKVRNPNATRPWQHIVDTVHLIYFILKKIDKQNSLYKIYNMAPNSESEAVKNIINKFKIEFKFKVKIIRNKNKEKKFLNLNSNKLAKELGIKNFYSSKESLKKVLNFYIELIKNKKNIKDLIDNEIENYGRNTKKLQIQKNCR
jgi:CDP-glucose 4,6-dehydratase